MRKTKELSGRILHYASNHVEVVVIVGLILVAIVLGVFLAVHVPDNTASAGTITCVPIGHHTSATGRNGIDDDCEAATNNPRFYDGRFTYLRHHSEDGVIFYDEARRQTRLSNVSCLVVYDEPR